MSHNKPSSSPSLKLRLKSANPKPMDIVGFFGRVPVTRITADAADALIVGTAKHLAKHYATLAEVLIATNGISVGLYAGNRKIPAERAHLLGTPYEIALRVPLTTYDLSEMLLDRGDVYHHFRDLVIACFGLCGMNEDDFEELGLVPLYQLRTQFAHAFGLAVGRWLSEGGKPF